MRIKPGVRLVKGAFRYAAYDEESGICEPLSHEQAAVLQDIAVGRVVRAPQNVVRRREYWRHVAELRTLGLLEHGRPRAHDLQVRLQQTESSPSAFRHVWLEITDSCNLECVHCYSDSHPGVDRSGELDEQSWIEIIRKLQDYGTELFTFIGGEPTIRFGLVRNAIEAIHTRSPTTRVRIFSNLVSAKFDDASLEFLKLHRVEFGTSLYGASPIQHDHVTQRKGSWLKTTSAIQLLRRNGLFVFAGFYIDSCREEDTDAIERLTTSLDLSSSEILFPSRIGRGSILDWSPSREFNTLPRGMRMQGRWKWGASDHHNCFFDHLAVSSNGEARPCIMSRNVTYGNLLDQSTASAIVTSQKFKLMAHLTKDKVDGCKVCEFRYGCFDCRPDAMGTSGNLYAKPNCGYDPRIPLGASLDNARRFIPIRRVA